jgi:hypothetical protein
MVITKKTNPSGFGVRDISINKNDSVPRAAYQVAFSCIIEAFAIIEIDAADRDAATEKAREAVFGVLLDFPNEEAVANVVFGTNVVAADHIITRPSPDRVFDQRGLGLRPCAPPDRYKK